MANSSVIQTIARSYDSEQKVVAQQVIFSCSGDVANGTIANADISAVNLKLIKGWKLTAVDAFPTSGGIAPDAADVMIYDKSGLDLLGSEDGGTTAYAGLNLIHATLARRCLPNLFHAGQAEHLSYYPVVTETLTLDVDNQATNSANFTVILTFEK